MLEVILDTETTGLSKVEKHRIVEIGCVELNNQIPTNKIFHEYINPQRAVSEEAYKIHGYSDEFLSDKKTFAEISEKFLDFIKDKKLIIHNAPFDLSFLNYEMKLLEKGVIDKKNVIDTLEIARTKFPGAQNSLDALCKRYGIDNSHRTLHGALLDAEILADVYLLMTGGQTKLKLASSSGSDADSTAIRRIQRSANKLKVIKATADEITQHEARLDIVEKAGGKCLWRPQPEEVS